MVRNGMYVTIRGSLKGFQGKRQVVAYSVRIKLSSLFNFLVILFFYQYSFLIEVVNDGEKRGDNGANPPPTKPIRTMEIESQQPPKHREATEINREEKPKKQSRVKANTAQNSNRHNPAITATGNRTRESPIGSNPADTAIGNRARERPTGSSPAGGKQPSENRGKATWEEEKKRNCHTGVDL
ncbi:hypothetical protein M5K25_016282 [Dendrobium thyrsiflorum]|uniref:Uncharacterized protein n=1 Tax=Dendrobium thyrsiflorum TaxID=117978 RepID=A0ABD0URN5_DENTH